MGDGVRNPICGAGGTGHVASNEDWGLFPEDVNSGLPTRKHLAVCVFESGVRLLLVYQILKKRYLIQ